MSNICPPASDRSLDFTTLPAGLLDALDSPQRGWRFLAAVALGAICPGLILGVAAAAGAATEAFAPGQGSSVTTAASLSGAVLAGWLVSDHASAVAPAG